MKPKANLRCVANNYADPNERIVEVTNGARDSAKHKGALIGLRNMLDGTFRIEVYRADPGIKVVMPRTNENGTVLE